jgi:hypothetical protein
MKCTKERVDEEERKCRCESQSANLMNQSLLCNLLTISLAYAASADLLAAATARPPASLRNWRERKGDERRIERGKERGGKTRMSREERKTKNSSGEERELSKQSIQCELRVSVVSKGTMRNGAVRCGAMSRGVQRE